MFLGSIVPVVKTKLLKDLISQSKPPEQLEQLELLERLGTKGLMRPAR